MQHMAANGFQSNRLLSKKAGKQIDSRHAAGFTDGPELGIGEVPLVPADGPRVGVTRYERTLGQAGNLVEANIVEMRDIEDDALLLHAAHKFVVLSSCYRCIHLLLLSCC